MTLLDDIQPLKQARFRIQSIPQGVRVIPPTREMDRRYDQMTVRQDDIHYRIRLRYRKDGKFCYHDSFLPLTVGASGLVKHLEMMAARPIGQKATVTPEERRRITDLAASLAAAHGDRYKMTLTSENELTIRVGIHRVRIRVERHDLESGRSQYLLSFWLDNEWITAYGMDRSEYRLWLDGLLIGLHAAAPQK